LAAASAGIKDPGANRDDLALIVADQPAAAAAVTTTNLVAAAPVLLTRQRIAQGTCQAVIMNSGNANACTGTQGMEDTISITAAAAHELNVNEDLVIPLSTGVIGARLPVDRILDRVPGLVRKLDVHSLEEVARAIMTTDTHPKTVELEAPCSTGMIHMVGLAKGAGMIAPNMATMLAVILVNARVAPDFLRSVLGRACERTFNRITVDGDTSTNDTLVAMAGGASESVRADGTPEDRTVFAALLEQACSDLAQALVRDGEGASKVVHVRVRGAADTDAALLVARTIAQSLLVKTALHGEDPNWGRIIAAAGRAGVPFQPERLNLSIGDVPVLRNGTPVAGDWEEKAHAIMQQREYDISLELNGGHAEGSIDTTDLSAEYVRINADYRS
jgi:glutamate N-acetyltransferase/amino-acid N-acetyltransferase